MSNWSKDPEYNAKYAHAYYLARKELTDTYKAEFELLVDKHLASAGIITRRLRDKIAQEISKGEFNYV